MGGDIRNRPTSYNNLTESRGCQQTLLGQFSGFWPVDFELVTRGFELKTGRFELVTQGFELVTCGFDLETRRFKLVTRGFELALLNFNLCI